MGVTCPSCTSSRSRHGSAWFLLIHGAGRDLDYFQSWVILARMVADAPGVPLDGRQGGVKGSERSMVDAGHGLQSMAIRVDCELLSGCFGDPAHRTAKQVRQVPSLAVIGWGHGDIRCLRFAHCSGNWMSCRSDY